MQPRSIISVADWTLLEFDELSSTSDHAAALPPWHAVRAVRQTAGRGRWQRQWVSDTGGLWITAVLPTDEPVKKWRALPLAVGLVLGEMLTGLGVSGVRLRWPNDVLVADRKLAGLLLEAPRPGVVLVGIGLNVTNDPSMKAPILKGQVTRLVDLLPKSSGIGQNVENDPSAVSGSAIEGGAMLELASHLLIALRIIRDQMATSGFGSLLPRLQPYWKLPRQVELDLGANTVKGEFQGVDEQGRLGLNISGNVLWYEAARVVQLREV